MTAGAGRSRSHSRGAARSRLSPDPADPDTAYVGLARARAAQDERRRRRRGGTSSCRSAASSRVAVSPVDGAVFAGCEPSRLFRSDDGGGSWRALDALAGAASRGRPGSSPPRPWTSHVRWIGAEPARRRAAPRRHRARRADALGGRRATRGRTIARAHSAMFTPSSGTSTSAGRAVRGRRRRRGLQRRRRRVDGQLRTPAATATTPGPSRPIPRDANRWWLSASTGPVRGARQTPLAGARSSGRRRWGMGAPSRRSSTAMPYALGGR